MNRSESLVSVFLPVYNAAAFLMHWWGKNEQELRSVDAHLLVVDNGSTDDTVNLIRAFDYENLDLILNGENLGVEGSIRVAKCNIRSKYCILLPADDWLADGYLENAVKIMEEDPSIHVVYGRSYAVNMLTGEVTERKRPPRTQGKHLESPFNAFLFNNFLTDISLFRSSDLCQDKNRLSWFPPGNQATILRKGPIFYTGLPQCFSGKQKDQLSKSWTSSGRYFVFFENVYNEFQNYNDLNPDELAFMHLLHRNFCSGDFLLTSFDNCLKGGAMYARVAFLRDAQKILLHILLSLIDDLLIDPQIMKFRKAGRLGSLRDIREIFNRLEKENRTLLSFQLSRRGCDVSSL